MIESALGIAYLACLGLLACYGLYRYQMVWLYYRVKHRPPMSPVLAEWPTVTIQIPVYNERYVVERAIRSACEVTYPRHRLQIQILDDSTDYTSALIARTLAPYQHQGLSILHLRRPDRRHFKAGALAEALEQATGEVVAIFDVDFVIPRDFLTRAVPYFSEPKVGMVQARWGHLNAEASLLTQSQAVLLDGHFAIEQVARQRAGRFFSFNGTAGIWRKAAILEAGGWQADTLTEDLDLSYRAQLQGWRCVYLQDLVAPAELPVEMNAFKTQQHRWTTGSIQTAKKLLPRILTSRQPLPVKLEAWFHLTAFFSFPIGLIASIGFPALLLGRFHVPHAWYGDAIWCLLLAIPGACFYICAQRELYPDWRRRLAFIPWVVAVGLGMSVNNALAVFEGLMNRRVAFVRTTKFGAHAHGERWVHTRYRTPQALTTWIELALAGYFAVGFLEALDRRLYLALPSLALFAAGFGYVGWLSLAQRTGLRVWRLQGARLRNRVLQHSEV